MSIKIPDLIFSPWFIWHERAQISGSEKGGVYRMALSGYAEPNPNMSWEKVRYIGMSISKGGLRQRWRSHDRHLRRDPEERRLWGDHGIFDHDTSRFSGNLESRKPRRNYLYVSAMPFGPSDIYDTDENGEHTDPEYERANGIIKYLEHEAFAQYLQHNKQFQRPKYNVL